MTIEVTSIEEKRSTKLKRRQKSKRALKRNTAARRKRRIIFRSILAFVLLILIAGTIFFIYSYNYYSQIVDARLQSGFLTSRAGIYAAPRTLRPGQTLSRERLVELLRRAGYQEGSAGDAWSGSFTVQEDAIEIHPRRSANSTPTIVRVQFNQQGLIRELTGDLGVTLNSYTLEPEILTTDAAMKTGKLTQLSYNDIPPVLAHAIISIEDRRFFEHGGVDIWGVARALWRNTTDDETTQGGSTITQQLVKNSFLTPERTLRRKFAEAMTALALEHRLSKQDILALYCNEIYLGQRGATSVRGVEQAARIYFGKELKDISLSEAATIAGMIQSPNRYAPDRRPEASAARRNTVLGTMLRDGFITREEAKAAAQQSVTVAPLDNTADSTAPYFIDYVNRMVESRLGAEAKTDERNLRIYTTIDLDLQQLAEASLKRQLERLDKVYANRDLKPQAALVAIDPKTGNILAMVGGRSYAESQLNRAVDALRQPGSVFKPIVYSAAWESGLSPLEMHKDAPQEFTYDGNAKYRPTNYGGGFSMKDVTMRDALVHSLNVVTVDVAIRTGLARVEHTAENFGLPKAKPYPSIALGTTEATPLDIAAAYTVFPNNGERVEPNVIARVTDSSGADIISEMTEKRQVIKPATAYMITDTLMDVIDHGTAHAARGSVKKTAIAGKTGTSRDGWFVGYTPNLVVAVWIGFDDNKQLGLTGAEAALPAWTEFIRNAVELRPELGGAAFAPPDNIKFIEIDPATGLLATASCPQHEQVAITATLAPNLECTTHSVASDAPDSTSAAVESDKAFMVEKEIVARVQPQPRLAMTVESAKTPSWRATGVEVDTHGQRTLVNEIRVTDRIRSP
jgi:penicillin-binding protein 1B